MRSNFFILAILCGVIALATFTTARGTTSTDSMKDFTYHDINDNTGTLYSINQPAVLHFWATWCRPCVAELPELITKANQTPDTTFLLISVDREKQSILQFIKPYTLNKNITVIHDPSMKITDVQFGINQFPETILLDKDKKIRRHLIGAANWSRIDLTR